MRFNNTCETIELPYDSKSATGTVEPGTASGAIQSDGVSSWDERYQLACPGDASGSR